MRNVFQSLCFTFICDNVRQSMKATRKLIEEQKQQSNDEVKKKRRITVNKQLLEAKKRKLSMRSLGLVSNFFGWIDLHWVDLDRLDKV